LYFHSCYISHQFVVHMFYSYVPLTVWYGFIVFEAIHIIISLSKICHSWPYTVNREILVWVNFGLFSPKEGCFILVCEILAIFVSSVFNFGHFWFPCLIFLSIHSERKWKCSHFNQRYYVFTVTYRIFWCRTKNQIDYG
jgi:hypothetical protein